MDKQKVSIIRCEDYNDPGLPGKVREAIDRVIDLSSIISSGTTVLLKVNLLYGTPPERAVTTHPEIVRAVGGLVKDLGGKVLVGDSSGFGSTKRNLKIAGIESVAKELGAEILPFTQPVGITHPDVKHARSAMIEKSVLDADIIINLPKLKTHALTLFTGAAKNLFGCLPGTQKGKAHVRLRDGEQLSALIVDLNRIIRPRLNVMDAVVGMEGWGPGSGAPKKVGVILAGTDTFAMDIAACEIIGQPPLEVPYIRQAAEQGLGPSRIEDVEILGEKLQDAKVEGFVLRPGPMGFRKFRNSLLSRAGNILRQIVFEVPVLLKKKCSRCFRCIEVCPVKSIRKSGRGPVFNYGKCIRCYCCQELCPEGALALKRKIVL
ncbi:MAG: DUF362 domain-containing protein [Planctomycetota bacterium]|jgi:uncharacterized protein (DUF362 family)/Pyruvate/2-oxoacid:ferredoxin oxidoreductase delta subunit